MARNVKLNHLREELDRLEYPVDRSRVRTELGDVTLVYADGEEPLVDVLDRIDAGEHDSPDDLASEVFNVLPVEAVGEPGQSEGDA